MNMYVRGIDVASFCDSDIWNVITKLILIWKLWFIADLRGFDVTKLMIWMNTAQ
jgi:hypothetical protein